MIKDKGVLRICLFTIFECLLLQGMLSELLNRLS